MSRRLLSLVLVSALIAGVAAASFIPSASAERSGAPRIETTTTVLTFYPSPRARLKVRSTVSQRRTIAKLTFAFSGDVTRFSLALPHGTALKTLRFARIAHDVTLDTSHHTRLRYRFLAARRAYLALDLRRAAAKFTLTFNTALLKFTRAEARLIKRHRVKTVGLAFTFVGAARQIAIITIKVKV
jgi:hypothetical protein